MSRDDAQFKLRLPHDLPHQIKADALANNRSVNAEIVKRLSEQDTSLRDRFAGQFLAGAANDTSALDISSAADQFDVDDALRSYWSRAARTAYIAADAMLAVRGHGQ